MNRSLNRRRLNNLVFVEVVKVFAQNVPLRNLCEPEDASAAAEQSSGFTFQVELYATCFRLIVQIKLEGTKLKSVIHRLYSRQHFTCIPIEW